MAPSAQPVLAHPNPIMTALQSPSLAFAHDVSKPAIPCTFTTPDNRPSKQTSQRTDSLKNINTHSEPSPPWSPNLPKTPTSAKQNDSSGKKSASKVSHVICKFYKAGNCSAGTACQFSHSLPEVGQGKPICQWFVKGNCRFAQKCALAHILPGQPISMDRKNKRAAQAAAREAAAPATMPPHQSSLSPSELSFPIGQPMANHSPSPDPLDYQHQPEILHANHASHHFNTEGLDLDHHSLQALHPHHLNDELEFGLPDDFTTHHLQQQHNFSSHPVGPYHHHQLQQGHPNHHFPAALSSPIHAHLSTDLFASHHSRPVSPEHVRVPISINRGGSSSWAAREQSPSPFGAGSPFSAPGSRSLFLPRPGSFGSEDGFLLHQARSAPSAGTSPHQNTFFSSNEEGMLWNEDFQQIEHDEDVTELLPSSLHSLLTPEERHRQHLRKHTQDLFSRSVPAHPSLSVRSHSPPAIIHQRETSASTLRASAAPGHLSLSYVPPPLQQQYTLSPPELNIHAPGTSLPQGLAAGLSRLHFQPPLPTGLTPACSPDSSAAELTHRIGGRPLMNGMGIQGSPLSRNVSFGFPSAFDAPGTHDDEDDRVLLGQKGVGVGGGGGGGGALRWRHHGGLVGDENDDDAPFELEI